MPDKFSLGTQVSNVFVMVRGIKGFYAKTSHFFQTSLCIKGQHPRAEHLPFSLPVPLHSLYLHVPLFYLLFVQPGLAKINSNSYCKSDCKEILMRSKLCFQGYFCFVEMYRLLFLFIWEVSLLWQHDSKTGKEL